MGVPRAPDVAGTGHGFPRASGDATWDFAAYSFEGDSTPWEFGGVLQPGGNFEPTPSDDRTFMAPCTPDQPYEWSAPQIASDVKGWVSGVAPNYGWELKNDQETTPRSFLAFWSRTGHWPGWHPRRARAAARDQLPALRRR